MGHQPKELQAEQGQSEMVEMDEAMEASCGECGSWIFQNRDYRAC